MADKIIIKEVDKRNLVAFGRVDKHKTNFASLNIEETSPINNIVEQVSDWTGNRMRIPVNDVMPSNGNLINQALKCINELKTQPGIEKNEMAEFSPDPHITRTSSGFSVVHLQQVYRGIPVFLVNRNVVFYSDGNSIEIKEIKGDTASLSADINITPQITAEDAMVVALKYLDETVDQKIIEGSEENGQVNKALNFNENRPRRTVEFANLPSRPTVLSKGTFSDYVPANLVLFLISPGARLGWHYIINIGEEKGQYEIVISADQENVSDNEILYLKKVSLTFKGKGKVFKRNADSSIIEVEFPLSIKNYPVCFDGKVDEFPDWLNSDETVGNNVAAYNSQNQALKGRLEENIVHFDINSISTEEQSILNLFYYCNYMHNFFWLLGFDEDSGNFQRKNISGKGYADDPVKVVYRNSNIGGRVAEITHEIDGTSPTIFFGFHNYRHSSLDADIVFHEYVHGVSSRLVGGSMDKSALTETQSKGLGEGWSDFFAISIQNYYDENEKVVIGDWLANSSAGFRTHPYDDHFHKYRTYADLKSLSSEHDTGEIWCAALLFWIRHLARILGKPKAYFICWQSVVDGMKLSASNPSFIDARDAIIMSLDGLKSGKVITEVEYAHTMNVCWKAFSIFGMGMNASSNGSSLSVISADFTEPTPINIDA